MNDNNKMDRGKEHAGPKKMTPRQKQKRNRKATLAAVLCFVAAIAKRIQAHNAGKGAKYTKSRLPVKLVYSETFATKEEAMSREYAIKHMKRKEKLQLIENRAEIFNI